MAKSKAASLVLKYMDKDINYSSAVKTVLSKDKRLSKAKLEKELEKYI